MIRVEPYLNLYGLEPYTFRLFAHVARRSQKEYCVSSLEKMATVCKMGVRKAQEILDDLERRGMIEKEYRYRQPSILKVNHDITKWLKPSPYDCQDRKLKSLIYEEQKKSRELYKLTSERLRSSQIIYLYGYLDLYGLNPYTFRIFSYIACQNICNDPLAKISTICIISVRKVQSCLRELVEQKLISSQPQKAQPTKYWLNPPQKWKEPLQDWHNQRSQSRLETYKSEHESRNEDYEGLEKYNNKLNKYTKELSNEMEQVKQVMELN